MSQKYALETAACNILVAAKMNKNIKNSIPDKVNLR